MLQALKNQVKVKLSIVSCPPVTTVLIKRPDFKFQLGFSVQNGIVSIRRRGRWLLHNRPPLTPPWHVKYLFLLRSAV